jgi:hypothetical protein
MNMVYDCTASNYQRQGENEGMSIVVSQSGRKYNNDLYVNHLTMLSITHTIQC